MGVKSILGTYRDMGAATIDLYNKLRVFILADEAFLSIIASPYILEGVGGVLTTRGHRN
jgi:hypothetical protein